ncbi:hypothetical protein GO998_17360 (plasmid) [Ralstonia syzygii]|uniref:Uncharacterized protein n=1 Tax=Ralstonia syzygii TaxID=28097 RepID=A0ABX7ZKT5_9RALS|nr:type VI secretion system amidase immunity protein Tai4 [Ralstonia syzygii]QUP55564.1 hypothetical protein GO998_17360 [Ralstonia syzygii]
MPCHAQGNAGTSPQAATRTYAQNDKDMVLATCIANAYRNDKDATADAGSRVSALRDGTVHDMEKSPDAVRSLVDRYLARNYANPLAEAEVKRRCFDRLKCLDLYHSRELEALARQLVIHPGHTYRQDNPPRAAPK